MNCPVCGTNANGNQFCPNCGGKIPVGDDTATQLLPENYMTSTGDDGVTQLIPDNYMTSQGDDTATVMLDPSQVQQRMPNQQPTFAQAPAPGFQQPYGQPQMGYQQPTFNQAPVGGYQNNYSQPASFGVGAKKSPAASKWVSLASLIVTVGLLIALIVLVTKPLFYITQSYMGGVATNEEIEVAVIEQDPDDYEEANKSARMLFGIAIVFVLIAALNAWSCYARISKDCVKSPLNKAVGTFVLGLVGMIIFIALKSMLDEVVVDGIYYGAFTPEEAAKFNVYNLSFVLGIVSIFVNLANIFTAASAKNATR